MKTPMRKGRLILGTLMLAAAMLWQPQATRAQVAAPGAFVKLWPANRAADLPLRLTLRWGKSAGATSYEYCYAAAFDCSNWVGTGTNTAAQVGGLTGETAYVWRVRARNASGTTYANAGDDRWFFSTAVATTVTVLATAAQDGWVLESTETSGVGGKVNATGAIAYVGDDSQNRQYRVILSFNTSGLPDDAVIGWATFMVRKAGQSAQNPFRPLGLMLVDIRRGAFNGSPVLQLGDFQAPVGLLGRNAAMNFANVANGAWYTKGLNSTNLAYINKTGVTQFRLRFTNDDDNDHIADYVTLYTGNYASASSRPELTIVYTDP